MFRKFKKWIAVLSIVALLLSLFPSYVVHAEDTEGIPTSTCSNITVDGTKDVLWDSVPTLGTSAKAGWSDFHINNLKLYNDCTYLYYFIDAVNLPNWGDKGPLLTIALAINNGTTDEVSLNSASGHQFNFSGVAEKPNYQILSQLKNNNELGYAAVYASNNLATPIATSDNPSSGALFAMNNAGGLEGRIPLSLLGLQENDTVKAIAVISGNTEAEHGAFHTIPETENNEIAKTWNESANPNVQADYSLAYTISFAQPTTVILQNSTIANGATNVATNLANMTLTFLDPLTVQNSLNDVTLVGGGNQVTISPTLSNNVLEITIDEALSYFTDYTLTIPADTFVNQANAITLSFQTERDPASLNTYNIHYYRYDGNHLNWDIWTWDSFNGGSEVDFAAALDSDQFATATITSFDKSINIITRPGDWSSEEPTRIVTMPVGANIVDVWMIGNDTSVYYDFNDFDLSARVLHAFMDSLTTIEVTTTVDLASEAINGFSIRDALNSTVYPVTAEKLGEMKYRLTIDSTLLDVQGYYYVEHQSIGPAQLIFRGILDAEQFYYRGDDLGLTYTPQGSTFKLWAPTAQSVAVSLYSDTGQYNASGKVIDHTGGQETLLTRSSNGVWTGTISGDLAGQYYMYHIVFANGTEHYVVDPYARAVAANGVRTAIVNLSATNPAAWDNDTKPTFINPTDAIIYELHVRDFSISNDSQVSSAYKGKYLAFTETGLTDTEGNKVGIDHLKELGITHVHLLPVYDFQTVNELTINDPNSSNVKFNWGYDPQNYNVPEGSYATDPSDPTSRITEFKQMVQAMHNNGIRVVMDVVYNHTYEIENGPFNTIVPYYYYRMTGDGRFSNGSGVGNEISTERPMVRKYIKDSVKYWANEYHIDGFRFDLMGIIDTRTMDEITQELHNEVDPTILVYGEPWMGGSTPLPGTDQTLKGSQKGLNFAVFNDNFRSAIKGDSDGGDKGYATGELNTIDGLINGIRGAIDDFTDGPIETINYVTAHDNLNLWDKVLKTQDLFTQLNMLNILNGELIGGGSVDDAVANATPYALIDQYDVLSNETVKRSLLANGIVLTAQGIPFIHAGDEFLRSKSGDHNSYRSPDSVNKINWTNKAHFTEVNDYYKGLIQLRKSHPAFRMTTKAAINTHVSVLNTPQNVLAFKLGENANGDDWKNIIVIYNGTTTDQTITLPDGNWNIVVDDKNAGVTSLKEVSTSVSVAGISMMVLYDEGLVYSPVPTSIELNVPKLAIEPNKQLIATARVKDQYGRILENEVVTWDSSDTNVATISSNGRITSHSHGVTTIKASLGNLSASKVLNVATLQADTVTLSSSPFIYEKMVGKVTATVKDQFGQLYNDARITWRSSDSTIATVDYLGTVTGKAPGTVTITATIGTISAQVTIEIREYVQRFIKFEYSRADQNYSDWDLWVWNTGVKNDNHNFMIENGKAVALIEIAPNVTQIGYIVRRGGNTWSEKEANMDRFVNVTLDETYVVVKITSGQVETVQTPRVISPVINGDDVTFRYRDDALYRSGQHDFITSVKVKFDGQEYNMMYDSINEYYKYTINDIEPGQYPYKFLVTNNGVESEISDPKNTVNGVSIVDYQVVRLTGTASISPSQFDYNSHAILSIQTTTPLTQISEIYADLSELGGALKVNISKDIQALTLSVTDTTTSGIKTIPVTFVDINQVTHTTQAQVTVQSRQINGANDFDWDEAVIYFMVTDRFKDGDSSNNNPNGENYDTSHGLTYHGGDIQGIINSLDYLDELGINTIWITPIVDNVDWNVGYGQTWVNQYGYHGYWAKDFTKIDEHLGDINTFKQLIDKAHDRGIKIMVDVVLNHAGYGMDSTKAAVPTSNYPTPSEQQVFDGMIRTNPIKDDDEKGELARLPDFVTEDPQVRDQIIQWQVDWLTNLRTSRGDTIDFYRVDTVKHVENETWYKFKNEITSVSPNFKLIGEVFGASVDDQRDYLGTGMMDSLLDFNFNNIAKDFIDNKIDSVEQLLISRNQKMNNVMTLGQFLSSHDEDGFLIHYAGNDLGKQKIAAALQITAKGQPVIYYGEELGMSGRNADYEAGIYDENRYDMPWHELAQREDMLTHYQALLHAREQYSKVFAKGTRAKVAGGDSTEYTVFERAYKDTEVYVGINTSDTAKTVTFTVDAQEGDILTNIYDGTKVTVGKNSQLTVQLPKRSEGGTFIIANPAPVIPNPSPSPSPTNDGNKIVVGFEHLKNGEYTVQLSNSLNMAQLIFNQLNPLPINLQLGSKTIRLTNEIIKQLQSQFTRVNMTINEVDNATLRLINNWAQQNNIHFEPSHTLHYVLSGTSQNGTEINTTSLTTTVSIDVTDHQAQTFYVYSVAEDGSLHYIPSVINNGLLQFAAANNTNYVIGTYEKTYNDVKPDHWAYELIQQATAMNLVNGQTPTLFNPNEKITRAAFISIIVRSLGLEAKGSHSFTDVVSGSWYEDAVIAAIEAGIVNGVSADLFNPQGNITREEMATIIVRVAQYNKDNRLAGSLNSPTYNDEDLISAWAKHYVDVATHAGFINGRPDGGFDPKGHLTRAEAVKVILALVKS